MTQSASEPMGRSISNYSKPQQFLPLLFPTKAVCLLDWVKNKRQFSGWKIPNLVQLAELLLLNPENIESKASGWSWAKKQFSVFRLNLTQFPPMVWQVNLVDGVYYFGSLARPKKSEPHQRRSGI